MKLLNNKIPNLNINNHNSISLKKMKTINRKKIKKL